MMMMIMKMIMMKKRTVNLAVEEKKDDDEEKKSDDEKERENDDGDKEENDCKFGVEECGNNISRKTRRYSQKRGGRVEEWKGSSTFVNLPKLEASTTLCCKDHIDNNKSHFHPSLSTTPSQLPHRMEEGELKGGKEKEKGIRN